MGFSILYTSKFPKVFFVKKHERRATIIYDYVYEEKMNVFIFLRKREDEC